jgi:hypothetical protein
MELIDSLILVGHFYLDRISQRCSLQLLPFLRHICTVQKRSSLAWNHFQDLVDLEVHVKNSASFVHRKIFDEAQAESFCVREMLNQTI